MAPRSFSVVVAVLPLLLATVRTASAQQTWLDPDDYAAACSAIRVSNLHPQFIEVPPADGRSFTLRLWLDGREHTARLDARSLRAPGLVISVDDGLALHPLAMPPVTTYRGATESGWAVVASVVGGGVVASVYDDHDNPWRVQPIDAAAGLHAIYRAADSFDDGGVCGLDHDEAPGGHAIDADEGHAGRAGSCPHICEMTFDADYEYFQLNGSSAPATAADIESILNEADFIFQRDNGVALLIREMVVRTTPDDPYSDVTNPGALLDEMSAVYGPGSDLRSDLNHLMTGRDLDGSVIGVAWLGTVCSDSLACGLSQSRYTTNFNNRVILTTHEIGHNYGAPHDNQGGSACASTPGGFIMNPSISGAGLTFSDCSMSRIAPVRDAATCAPAGAAASPNALGESVTALEGVPARYDVLANDTVPCGLGTIELLSPTSLYGGPLEITAHTGPDGRDEILYTPPAGRLGPDFFAYRLVASNGQSDVAQVAVTIEPLRPADAPAFTEPGLAADYYVLSNPSVLPDFTQLTPYQSDVAAQIDFPSTSGAFSTSGRSDNLGVVYDGFIEVPAAAVYTLSLESDDGSRLLVGSTQVVSNDGLHGMVERSGTIALAPGTHAVRIEFFERTGGAGLIARIEGGPLARAVVPGSMWHHAVPPPPCPGDFNGDGVRNTSDFFEFFAAFFAVPPEADYNTDGATDSADFFEFFADFFGPPCP